MLFGFVFPGSEETVVGFMVLHDIVPAEFDGFLVFLPGLFGIPIVKFPGGMGGWFYFFP